MKANSFLANSLEVTQFLQSAPAISLQRLLTQFPGYQHLHFEVESSPPPQNQGPAPNWNFLMQQKKDLTSLPVKKDPARSIPAKIYNKWIDHFQAVGAGFSYSQSHWPRGPKSADKKPTAVFFIDVLVEITKHVAGHISSFSPRKSWPTELNCMGKIL